MLTNLQKRNIRFFLKQLDWNWTKSNVQILKDSIEFHCKRDLKDMPILVAYRLICCAQKRFMEIENA